MRSGFLGFVVGVVLMVAIFLGVQQQVIRASADDLTYVFSRYVFHDKEFPWNYFASGRVISRFLFPAKVKITYYDAQYNEVTIAEKPGRYGAVVRIALNGGVVSYRYVTLYRSPEKVFWGDGTGSVSGFDLPSSTGIDPAIVRNQQAAIGQNVLYDYLYNSPGCAIILAGLSETSPQDPPATVRNSLRLRDRAWWYGLRKKLGLLPSYSSVTDLPEGYEADPNKKWPLILYLHSDDCGGTNLAYLRRKELPGVIQKGLRLPAIVVAPLNPGGEDWSMPVVNDYLDALMTKYRVDPDRVYLAGSSTGGDYTVGMGSQRPERFAAITTVAGENDFSDLQQLTQVPYWAFEGANDEVMNPANPVNLVADIRKAGGKMVHLTLYPGMGHGSWEKAFSDPALWQWLLAQKRGQPEVVTPGVPP